MNVAQAAKMLGCSEGHIRMLVSKGKLHPSKIKAASKQKAKTGYVLEFTKEDLQHYETTKRKGLGGKPKKGFRKLAMPGECKTYLVPLVLPVEERNPGRVTIVDTILYYRDKKGMV